MTSVPTSDSQSDRDSATSFAKGTPEDHRAALAYLGVRLAEVDLIKALRLHGSAEAMVNRMMYTLPDTILTDPPIGPCYSSSALARWKQVSRQAIDQQRRSGRLFGVLVGGRMFYPSVQFDNRGRQSRAFAEMYADAERSGRDQVEFGIWMETPDPVTGVRPSDTLRLAPDTRTPHERLLDNFVPTVVDPPYGAAAAEPDIKE
jgi:hypothetical protein